MIAQRAARLPRQPCPTLYEPEAQSHQIETQSDHVEVVGGDPKICKVSIVGIGMRSHVGVAAKMFRTLAEEGINIQMVTTSEIKTSVVIDEKSMELAVRALHRAFDLEPPPAAA